MKKQAKGTYNFDIHSFQTNQFSEINITALFQLLQESAYRHAETNNFGYSFLIKHGMAWVLSSMYLEITNVPAWGDNIEIRTWALPFEGLLARREFEVIVDNKKIIQGTSMWLIISLESKRPQRLTQFKISNDIFCDEKSIDTKIERLIPSGNFTFNYELTVRPSLLDLNRHINNANYVRMIMDCYKELRLANIKKFQINYLQEAILGDQLFLYENKNIKNDHLFKISRKADDKNICLAKVSLSDRLNKIIK